jgi:hypothetical protein
MAVISPVVQVVSTGTDWPAIVAAISTGVVGLAGIGGTLWSGKRSITAEDRRAQLAEKRRIYAAYRAALNDFVVSSSNHNTESDRSHYSDVRATFFNTTAEVVLIAPANIRDRTLEVGRELSNYAGSRERDREIPWPAELSQKIADLDHAMRADLGVTD